MNAGRTLLFDTLVLFTPLQLHDIQFGPVKQSSVVDTTPITLVCSL